MKILQLEKECCRIVIRIIYFLNMLSRTVRIIGCTASVASLGIAAVNYLILQQEMSNVLQLDTRNEGMQVFVHFKYFVNRNVLVYDLRDVSSTSSPMDVTRVLLQFAATQKDRSFDVVELSHQGSDKFKMQGVYFQQLGAEYGTQNPAYTIRTMPENLYKPDGEPAFGTWTGGMLGVLARQMEDVAALHRIWYIDDFGTAKGGHDD